MGRFAGSGLHLVEHRFQIGDLLFTLCQQIYQHPGGGLLLFIVLEEVLGVLAGGEAQVQRKDKKSFAKDFKAELKKVTWPTPKQLVNNTTAVVVIVLITAIIVFVLDIIFENANKYGVDKLKTIVANEQVTDQNTSEDEQSSNTTVEEVNNSSEDTTTTESSNTTSAENSGNAEQ